jgi:Domain of unknown function (DUF1995)
MRSYSLPFALLVGAVVIVSQTLTCESYAPRAPLSLRRGIKTIRSRRLNVGGSAPIESSPAVESPNGGASTDYPELRVPLSWDEMIRQVSSAIGDATKQDQDASVDGPISNRLIARVLLPRDAASGDFGRALENDPTGASAADYDGREFVLTPIDESWQGGIMQLYRSAAPTASALLRRLMASSSSSDGGLPARIVEDRSVDESGVDGVGLFTTSDGKYSVWVQPTQENVDEICARSSNKDNGHVQILLNPQWRLVDDALDVASKGTGPLAGLANFLGGKGRSQQRLADAGFVPVYTLEGYVCRGSNVRLLQVRDSPWHVFCQRDDYESFLLLGTVPVRPTYQQVDDLLNQADIGYKYARDIGLAPKL